ncbi:MAG: PKD domain-containing protein [Planctomycetota bacterium]
MRLRTLVLIALPVALAVLADDSMSPDPAPGLDLNYFQDKIEPILVRTCAEQGCHGTKGAGNLQFQQPDFFGRFTAEQSKANFLAASRFIVPKQPMASPFLTKPLAEAEGGLPHGGGVQYDIHKADPDYQSIVDFIQGSKIDNVAPTAVATGPQRIKRGGVVRLDGAKSADRNGDPITMKWAFEAKPKESQAALDGAEGPTPSFTADCDGTYTVSLTVSDDKGKSDAASVIVVADSMPIVMLEAEDGRLEAPMEKVADRNVSNGAFICVSDEDAGDGAATWDVDVPQDGDYDLWGRVFSPPSSTAKLLVSVDGGPEKPWDFAGITGWNLLPMRDKSSSRRSVAGQWATKEGALTCVGFEQKGYAVCTTGATLREGTIEFKVRCDKPQQGRGLNGFLVFDYRSQQSFKFAGFFGGRKVWSIGESAGRRQDNPKQAGDEFQVNWNTQKWTSVKVELSGKTATLTVDGKEVGSKTFASSFNGEVALASLQSSPWFDDLRITDAGGNVVYEDAFDTKKGNRLALKAGPHKLTVKTDGGGLGLDHLILIKSELDASVDVETRRFVRKVYMDCLGRGPTELEVLIAAGQDRKAFVEGMTRSLEFYQTWYENELFYFLLLDNFRPSTPSLVAIPSRLQNGQISVRDALQEIVISQYFNSRNPGNDTFVTVVFEQLLGMKVQSNVAVLEAGKKMYDGYDATIFGVAGKNQSDVVKIAMRQPDYGSLYIRRLYGRMVGHAPSEAVLAASIERFNKTPYAFPDMIGDWLLSEDYAATMEQLRPKSDEMYIRTLYVDLLGRQANFAETRKLRNALLALSDKQPLRSVLAKIILDSNLVSVPTKQQVDKPKWVTEQFVKLLGREPSEQELAGFVSVLDDPAGTTKLVIQAILTSAEYQYY